MKRICFFAGYDKDGIIDDYIIYYIKKLSEISDVYYFGDFNCSKKELNKLINYCKGVYSKRHGEYDFGSWNKLVKIIGLKEIRKYDELILANDSCFGPLKPLEPIFEIMEKQNCDFWGLSCSRGYHIHIQSYFLVFNNNIIKSDCLFDFLDKVVSEESLQMVCDKYEDRIAYVLTNEGFRFKSYVPYGEFNLHPYFNLWSCISNDKVNFPFIKAKVFTCNVGNEPQKNWIKFIKDNTYYDYNLILNNLKRRGLSKKDIQKNVYISKVKKNFRAEVKSLIRKMIKLIASPLIRSLHSFVDNKILEYASAIDDRLNEMDKKLSKLYNISVLDEKAKYEIKSKGECKLHFNQIDTYKIVEYGNMFINKNEIKKVLLLGTFSSRNKEFIKQLNNHYVFIDEKTDKTTMSIKKENKNVRFDLIIIQNILSIEKFSNIEKMFNNLKDFAMQETTFVLSIENNNNVIEKYNKLLKKLDFVEDFDAKRMFGNKIITTNKYKKILVRIK